MKRRSKENKERQIKRKEKYGNYLYIKKNFLKRTAQAQTYPETPDIAGAASPGSIPQIRNYTRGEGGDPRSNTSR